MPEFVTALHDFVAEDEEDLPFRSGDRIEVIEKDGSYDDAWWKGRNPQGKVGLFPSVFTAPAPSSTDPLYDIFEEEESGNEIHDEDQLSQGESSKHEAHTDHEEQHPKDENQPQVDEVDEHQVEGEHLKSEKQSQVEQHTVVEERSIDEEQPDDEEHPHDKDNSDSARRLERAHRRRGAIIDLQTAVEALGPRVAETRVCDGNDDEGSPPDWLGYTFQWEGFREMLQNAWRMADVQDLLTESATTISHMSSGNGAISDTLSKDKAETQNSTTSSSGVSKVSSLNLLSTKTPATEKKIPSFGLLLPASTSTNTVAEDNSIIVTRPRLHRTKHSGAIPTDTCVSFGLPSPATTDPNCASRPNTESALSLFSDNAFPSQLSSPLPAAQRVINPPGASRLNTDSMVSFLSTNTSPSEGLSPLHAGQRLTKAGASRSNINSVASLYSNNSSAELSSPLPADQHSTEKTDDYVHLLWNNGFLTELPSPFLTSQHLIAGNKAKQKLPSDWTLQEVVEWLKSKGFDQNVCNKFIEHEITGDVLLELDVNLLKTEIGVMAFGNRTRIANAITDLRQSHPVNSTDHQPMAEIPSSSSPNTPSHFDTQVEVYQERSSMRSSLPPPSSPEQYTPLHFSAQVHEIRLERSSMSSSLKSIVWQRRPTSLPVHPTPSKADIKVHETRQEKFSTSESSTGVGGEILSASLPLRRSSQRSDKVSEIRRESRSPPTPPKTMCRPLPTIPQVSSTPSDSLNGEAEEARTSFNDSWQATEEGKKIEKTTPDMASIRRNSADKRRIAQASNNSDLLVRKDSVGIGAMLSGSTLHPIGEPDHAGWLRKKNDRYNFWKSRYFILKGQHLYWLKSAKPSEKTPKGIIDIVGYKITTVDNTFDSSGRYGFRIDRDQERTYFFSSDDKNAICDWTKAIMKATISWQAPVASSCNISTVPLSVARAMNPVPRPPSPTAQEAIQRSLRRRNTDNLSSRDTHVLLGLSSYKGDGQALSDSPAEQWQDCIWLQKQTSPQKSVLRRPSMPEMRRVSSTRSTINSAEVDALVQWANSHLPTSLQVQDSSASLFSGLALLRLAESIKGPCSPPVPDNAFPTNPGDERVEGLFRLLELLLNNGVKMGRLSINDIRHGRRDKILALLKALKTWEGQLVESYRERFIVPISM